jgi:hypothetical protein
VRVSLPRPPRQVVVTGTAAEDVVAIVAVKLIAAVATVQYVVA